MSDVAGELEAEVARLRAEVERLQRRLAETEALADRDPLTPLLNRRAFVRELERAQAFQARYGGEAALIYLDMDGLKVINDRFGHAAGDAAIAAVAATLLNGVRESDLVGRLGGDEFGVLLARSTLPDATLKAEALAAAIAAEPCVAQGRRIALSVSCGVRPLVVGRPTAALLAEADAAMYLAKGDRGRG